MECSIDSKKSDWWTTPRLQWIGSLLASSAATCLDGFSGESCRQKESSRATSTARLTVLIAVRSSLLLVIWSSASGRRWMDYRAKFSIGGWPEYLAGADSMQASR